jgi:hypothetical protein
MDLGDVLNGQGVRQSVLQSTDLGLPQANQDTPSIEAAREILAEVIQDRVVRIDHLLDRIESISFHRGYPGCSDQIRSVAEDLRSIVWGMVDDSQPVKAIEATEAVVM